MPELIMLDSFSLLVNQQWVIAGALAADSHAQDCKAGRVLLVVVSQHVIRQGGEPGRGPDKHNANKEEG